jgi:hypothetical protein
MKVIMLVSYFILILYVKVTMISLFFLELPIVNRLVPVVFLLVFHVLVEITLYSLSEQRRNI